LSRKEAPPTVQHNSNDKKPPFWNGLMEEAGRLVSAGIVTGDFTYSGSTCFLPFSIIFHY
jgi:hypothetical protein